ncbi:MULTISPECIES: hypothetical protein [Microbulbifer]|uniref:hypothetical protein n=1 Tax=Microbulbifer TaxID=48073 RepID=UPI001143C309|nr:MULTISPECIES: hypothetical protein [Microbulbifer]
MKLRFLCAHHRQWLIAEPQRAERWMLGWVEQGEALLAQEGPEQALPFFGCALELADFLLIVRGRADASAVRRFSDCARHLLATAAILEEWSMCHWAVGLAQQRLAEEPVAAIVAKPGESTDGLLH